MTATVTIRVLRDEVEPGDPSGPVPSGTIVDNAHLPDLDEVIIQQDEVWYQRPDTGEDWLSLPGDYEVIE